MLVLLKTLIFYFKLLFKNKLLFICDLHLNIYLLICKV